MAEIRIEKRKVFPSIGNAFTVIQPDSGTSPTASTPADTLTLTSGNALLGISGDSATKTITFTVDQTQIDHTQIQNIGTNTHAQIDAHIADVTGNPHNVTADQAGALAIDGSNAMTGDLNTNSIITSNVAVATGANQFTLKNTNTTNGDASGIDNFEYFRAQDNAGNGLVVRSIYPDFFGSTGTIIEAKRSTIDAFAGLSFVVPGVLGIVGFRTAANFSQYVGFNPGALSIISSVNSLNFGLQGGSFTAMTISGTNNSDNRVLFFGTGNGATDVPTIGDQNHRLGDTYMYEGYKIRWGNRDAANNDLNRGHILCDANGTFFQYSQRADGAVSYHILDTINAITNTGAKLLNVRNAGVSKFSINNDGGIEQVASARNGFYGAAPIAQPSSTGETLGFTAGTGTAVNDVSTFTGNVGTTAYTISDIVKHLKNLGLLAQ